MKEEVKKILDAIACSETILVSSHIYPDGDSVSSVLGLGQALEKAGKKVTMALWDSIPEGFRFLPGVEKIKSLREIERQHDLLVLLDLSDETRLGRNDFHSLGKLVVNVDHHICNRNIGDLNWIVPRYSATTQLVYELLRDGGYAIDEDVATCLLTGLMTDTVRFSIETVDSYVFQIASELVARGAKPDRIAAGVYQSATLPRLKSIGIAVDRVKLECSGALAWSWISFRDLEAIGALPEDSGASINMITSIKGIQVSVFFYEEAENRIVIAFRSRGELDVNEIAQLFGGGGHKKASGCMIKDLPLHEAKEKVLGIVCQRLDALGFR